MDTCKDCGEPEDEAHDLTLCCRHDDVENNLGFGGDPAREDPRNGTCVRCGIGLHMEPDEDGNWGWEID